MSVPGYDLRKIARWIRLCGGAPGMSAKDPAAHILWIRENEPDVYPATFKFLEPVDWLTNGSPGASRRPTTRSSSAGVTDNRRIDAVDYAPQLCRMAWLERSKLPDLVPSASIVGLLKTDVAGKLGLRAGRRCSPSSPWAGSG